MARQALATQSARNSASPKRVAIVQSNYIPWKGYFDLIKSVDEFILFDDMQYTKRDWRNRNRIKTRTGLQWLTIPVAVKGKFFQKIRDTQVSDPAWGRRHWETIRSSYRKAPFFRAYQDVFAELYLTCQSEYLSEINYLFLSTLCSILGISARFTWSSDYRIVDGKSERLIDLCKQAQAQEYLSGPSARGYIDEALFASEGIKVTFADYSGYPQYPQLFPPFDHAVSVIDLIFNVGPDAPQYMKSF